MASVRTVLMQRRSRSLLDIALFGGGPKIQSTMTEISSGRPLDSSGKWTTIATNALLGVLAALLMAQLAPWGDGENSGTTISVALGALGGALLGRLVRPGLLVVVDGVLLGVYLIVMSTPVMTPFTQRWIRVDALPGDTLDAIISLSAGVKTDSALNVVAADRLLTALELMRQGHARRLITSRQVEKGARGPISSDADQRRLITLGSLAQSWTIVDSVHSTRDEAVRIAELLIPTGARSIILVTSPMHTRRACAAFEAVGFRVYCQASRERDFATNPPYANRDRLAAVRAYGYEVMGMIKYRMKGWLKPGPVVTPAPGGSS
jgi:uncharacterized SAM-binding protein YcdF (DUF218 family)